MCYSLSLQSPINFRNRHSLKPHRDRSTPIPNSPTQRFPSRFGGNITTKLYTNPRNRLTVHSSDARRIPEEMKQPDFSEFITSERVKVVAMLALALALCNADRVVMSVAIVPLSVSRGWSKSFSGIVQSSFLWGYLISPIAGGTLVDRYLAGYWSDLLIRRGTSITLTRKIMQSIGFIGPGIALIGLTTAKQPLVASAWLSLAVGLKSFSHLGFLINLQEIAPEYSGVLHGMCLTAGTLAAIVGTVGTGFFVEKLGSFQGFILLTAILYLLSALFYNIYATGERVNFDTPAA